MIYNMKIIINQSLLLLMTIVLFSACSKTENSENSPDLPEQDIFSVKWAKFLNSNPGGKIRLTSQEQSQHVKKAASLNSEGYNLYRQKQDEKAVQLYEEALAHHATGELYYNYGNSLSNISRLEDSVKAYEIANILGYIRPELVLYNSACVYSRMQNREKAYEMLAAAVDRGYNAFQYMEKDPDMEFLRSQSDWKEKINSMIPVNVELSEISVSGAMEIPGPRVSDYFILCPGGKFIQSEGMYPSDGSCCQATLKGTWELRNGDLYIQPSEVCESLGQGESRGCGGACCPFESCSPVLCKAVSQSSRILLQKHDVKNAIAGKSTAEDAYWDLKFTPYSSNLSGQCDK